MLRHAIQTLDDLHARSVAEPEWFWRSVIDYLEIPFIKAPSGVLAVGGHSAETQWFEDGLINLAHACLTGWQDVESEALVSEDEDGSIRCWSGRELVEAVQRGAGLLHRLGLEKGDRAALLMPFCGEGIIAMLSVAWAGGVVVPVFSGFGAGAVAHRMRDCDARFLITTSSVERRGERVRLVDVAQLAVEASEPRATLVVWMAASAHSAPSNAIDWTYESTLVTPVANPEPTRAEDPVLIAYTSGTTGRPKGVVHVHGGLTVKLAQEGAFQLDVRRGDRLTWITDLGWIMSLWTVVAALVNRACVVAYSGAPATPNMFRALHLVARHGLTGLGMSPSLARLMAQGSSEELSRIDVSSLRVLGSTGEPWTPDSWWWLYENVGQRKLPIINFTGGTEVGACFLSASMLQGIKPTSVGSPCLGMDVAILRSDGTIPEDPRGLSGELVCRDSWPSMARGFWGDDERFRSTYWRRNSDVWMHGDLASCDGDGFWYLHGRSDDVFNVAGKRMGPEEIEASLADLPGVEAVVALGINHPTKGQSVAVCLVLKKGQILDEALVEEVQRSVKESVGKPFMPETVTQIPSIPRTRSGKVARRVLRSLLQGDDPGDLSVLEGVEGIGEALAPRQTSL